MDRRLINFKMEGMNCKNRILLIIAEENVFAKSIKRKKIKLKNRMDTTTLSFFKNKNPFIYSLILLILRLERSYVPTPRSAAWVI